MFKIHIKIHKENIHKKYAKKIHIKNMHKNLTKKIYKDTEVHLIVPIEVHLIVPIECQGYTGQQTDRKSK